MPGAFRLVLVGTDTPQRSGYARTTSFREPRGAGLAGSPHCRTPEVRECDELRGDESET